MSTDLRLLHGSDRGKLRSHAPIPEPKAPLCPKRLTPEARTVWRYVVRELTKLGVIAKADKNPLERYCRLVIEERKLAEWVDKYGLSFPLKDGDGKVKCFQQFPEVAQLNRTRTELLKLEVQFGLTPSARTRIQVEPQEKPEAVRKRTRGA